MRALNTRMHNLRRKNSPAAMLKRMNLRRQSGQALVEMAFVVPLLLLLALGVIEVGRYAYIAILVGNAARAGADYGAQSKGQSTCLPPLPCGIQTAAANDFQSNGQPAGGITVTVSDTCGCDSGGSVTNYACSTDPDSCPAGSRWVVFVSVTAQGPFSSLFNYPGIPSSLTISRTATVPVV
jgi:Flp pilus assembly protein TadG